MDVLQRDVDECREKWNTHTIDVLNLFFRPVKQSHCLSGKPEVMHNLPHGLVLSVEVFISKKI